LIPKYFNYPGESFIDSSSPLKSSFPNPSSSPHHSTLLISFVTTSTAVYFYSNTNTPFQISIAEMSELLGCDPSQLMAQENTEQLKGTSMNLIDSRELIILTFILDYMQSKSAALESKASKSKERSAGGIPSLWIMTLLVILVAIAISLLFFR